MTALANVYVDLGNWHGITPYVGAGVGVCLRHDRRHRHRQSADGDVLRLSATRDDWNFAWASDGRPRLRVHAEPSRSSSPTATSISATSSPATDRFDGTDADRRPDDFKYDDLAGARKRSACATRSADLDLRSSMRSGGPAAAALSFSMCDISCPRIVIAAACTPSAGALSPDQRDTPPHRGAPIWKGSEPWRHVERPALRPANPRFSTGPTAKRPGWSPEILKNALARPLASLQGRQGAPEAGDRRDAPHPAACPPTHRIAIVPASDTGAMEMALWSLLGARGVDVLAWESFGAGWVDDVVKQLKLADVRVLEAPLRRAARPRRSRFRPRRGLHLERHDLRRARAGRRLDRRRPRRPHDLRRDQRRLRAAACPSTSSMSSPSPGRRCWAARRSTAC